MEYNVCDNINIWALIFNIITKIFSYTYSEYDDFVEDASENIKDELISGKLESNLTTLKTKPTQNMLEKSPSVKPWEEGKLPLKNIDESNEEGI